LRFPVLNFFVHFGLTQNEPKGQGCEKRAKSDGIPLKEINAPSLGLRESQLPCGMISFFTLHSVIFFKLFFLRPRGTSNKEHRSLNKGKVFLKSRHPGRSYVIR
jgi:hypothetical protein